MDPAYVSTGDLPTPGHVQALVSEAHERYRSTAAGLSERLGMDLLISAPAR